MASVDDRIVAMKFENAAFEQKIATTMASLDKLKGSLDFANANRGLADLKTAGHNFSLEGIASAVSGIEQKFSVMGAVALSVINSIVSRAFTAGESLVKSLSLDQIIGGYKEYETNLNSIQTVLANTKSKGTQLEDVNAALDQLNTYSDQTIYNFSQMARNIGTFTAAGVNLDASVAGIKGIANLAAISGSNADQASTAMYQLSQALASGSVKLMDWNSVVNAGMGGEVFQKALFETGKNLKTIKDVPMGQTFDQWKAAGNTFRSSLESGWITAQVLTDTLSTFTGDLTEAQILAMGYTKEQTAGILEMGKTGKEAATKVKTLSQLISTVKEAIGSGWSASFRIIFGDFEEARTLFTSVSDALNKIVGSSAASRNALLQNWKNLGGRQALIDGIANAFHGLAGILSTMKAAWHDVFPPFTVITLMKLTNGFKDLMARLTPSPAVAVLLTRTFRGIFSLFSIGIEIVKGIASVFGNLFDMFNKSNDPNSGILGFTARVGDGIYALKQSLVDGGGIAAFFDNVSSVLGNVLTSIHNFVIKALPFFQTFIDKVIELKNWVTGLFKGDGTDTKGPDLVEAALGRLGERFGWLIGLGHILVGVWDKISQKFPAIGHALGTFVDFIQTTFSGLPQKIADALSKTDYNKALDTVNTGLFGSLTIMIGKFLHGGFNLGGSGLFKNINKSFQTLTGTLQAMQTNLKAETLLKIAEAVGLLTASIVVLSLIDSGALTKSMAAMAVGFGQLVTVMALLDKLTSGPIAASKLAIISTGMILLAGAMVIMSAAVKILSSMSPEELAKGLIAITLLLNVLSTATLTLSDNSGGMIRAGIGLIAIAVALNILALAVKSFAEMNWADMAKGMAGVAAGLLVIVEAMGRIPEKILLDSIGLIAIAVALNILALAVKSFAEMNWADMTKGIVGVAGVLIVLGIALDTMPNGASLALQGVGLALIGVGLTMISAAMKVLGGMSWGQIAKGLTALAGTLVLLAFGMAGMEEGLPGAAALLIASIALGKLAKVLKTFAGISWGDLLHGLGAIAATMAVLSIASLLLEPAIVPLLLFGAALVLLGAGMALFGLGASLLATAFAVIATAGTEGIATLAGVLDTLISHLPKFIAALAEGLIELGQRIVEALPGLISKLSDVIGALLQLIIDNIPKLGEAFKTLIMTLLDVMVEVTPDIIAAGFKLLIDFLSGIRDNIAEITTLVSEIIIEFLNALAGKTEDMVTAGLGVLVSFLNGIANNLSLVLESVGKIITALGDGVTTLALDIIAVGKNFIVKVIEGFGQGGVEIANKLGLMIVQFLEAITTQALDIMAAGTKFIVKVIEGFGKAIVEIAAAMAQFIVDVLNGLADVIRTKGDDIRKAGANVVGAIIDGMSFGLSSKSGGFLSKFGGFIGDIITTSTGILHAGSPSKVFIGIAQSIIDGLVVGFDNDTSAEKSIANLTGRVITTFQQSLSQIPTALDGLNEFTPTITPVLDLTNVIRDAGQLGDVLGSAAQLSYNQAVALSISSNSPVDLTTDTTATSPKEIKFEQNNYSPEALTVVDIYRQTRNQIAMAKEELSIL